MQIALTKTLTKMLNKTFVNKLNELFSGSGLSLCLWYVCVPTRKRIPILFFQFFYKFCSKYPEYDFSDDSDFNDESVFLTTLFEQSHATSSTYSLNDFTNLDTPTLLTNLYEGDVSENVCDVVNIDGKYCVLDGDGNILFNPLELEITDTTTTSSYLRVIKETTDESNTSESTEGN